jgi:DNA-directed RNA polymerase subunit beta'
MLKTTVGQLMVNEALPPDMRDYTRVLDKGATYDLLREVVEKHPEKYRDIAKRLADVGRNVAFTSGGQSFGLRDLRPTPAVHASRARLNRQIDQILNNSQLTDDEKEARIVEATSAEHERLQSEILDEAAAMGNPLARQVMSGAKGGGKGKAGLKRLIGGDMLYVDHHDKVIPFPVQSSFAEGLTPAEFWASTYGARKGLLDVKFATQDAGFFSKQLNQLAHRLLVTAMDADKDPNPDDPPRGYPVNVDDPDNAGALLAMPVGDLPRNTVLTPKILKDLENQGIDKILVRSPIVGGPESGGVYGRDVGVRERGGIAPLGDMVGLAAAQALSEKLTQGQLASKHAGGVKGQAQSVSGFQRVNQTVQVPKTFKGGAAHAQLDGKVTNIVDAPAGGKYITISGKRHYVLPGFELKVEHGDNVEAGDVLSEGMPNPAEIVKHKGIGEGRRYFIDIFGDAYRAGRMHADRRNIELVARGLIDHVEMLEEADNHVPGDVLTYQQLESTWRPRDGHARVRLDDAVGKYLERPVLHYTIGTRIKPSMLPLLRQFGVKDVDVHDNEPPFAPRMVRAMAAVGHDPDWMSRFLGSNQKKNLLDAAHRGAVSDAAGSSFVPALAEGVSFGKTWPQSVLTPRK